MACTVTGNVRSSDGGSEEGPAGGEREGKEKNEKVESKKSKLSLST